MNRKIYRTDLDILKGIAILAVVLYHAGICTSGYLGVDAFFVISGFLVVPKVINDIAEGHFSYFKFLEKRIVRLLPLLLIVSFVCMVVGYYTMLPDDYENLNETVVASNLFSNNILAAITTKNYWSGGNAYKPLMHTWYVGILMEFYVIFPLIVILTKKFVSWTGKNFNKVVLIVMSVLSICSMISYLTSSGGNQFYYLHNRFYELSLGGIVGVLCCRESMIELTQKHLSQWLSIITSFILVALIFFGVLPLTQSGNIEYDIVNAVPYASASLLPKELALISVVLLTCFYIFANLQVNDVIKYLDKLKLWGWLGKMSYSIFLWHQPILAFYRYTVSDKVTLSFIVFVFVSTALISITTYYLIENRIKVNKTVRWAIIIAFIFVNSSAFKLYLQAGVVRDVPELGVTKGISHRGLFAEYCDRVYSYDKDFSSDKQGKPNILVVGVSFARDLTNVLLESDLKDSINISYIYNMDKKYINRVSESDYIFYFDWKHNVPDYVWNSLKEGCKVYGIGTKNFGTCNGIIYNNRNGKYYFDQTVSINKDFFLVNEMLKKEWGDYYVDMLTPVVQKDGTVKVFSDERKFLSQDCKHLTEGGARYYSKLLNLNKIIDTK